MALPVFDDDAALFSVADREPLIVTSDLLTDGVHFRLADTDPRRIGRKALAFRCAAAASSYRPSTRSAVPFAE